MVAILDSPPPISSFKSVSLRARLKMEEKALESSLKETRSRDSEPECMSDYCSDDSYSSSADFSCSSGSPGYTLTMSSLRCATSAPVVSKSRINVTTAKQSVSVSRDSPTRSKLTQLLHTHNSVASTAHTHRREVGVPGQSAQPSTRLFQIAWQMLPSTFSIRFGLRDSTTVDPSKEKAAVGEFLVKESQGKVLEALTEPDTDKARARECRMNKDFLRIYALDYSARVTGALPASSEECNSSRSLSDIVGLYSSDEDEDTSAAEDERQRISRLSQDKLWKCVILPPRPDPTPCRTIDASSYVHSQDTSGTWRVRLDAPKKSMEPAGQLKRSRCLQSPDCPYSDCTVPQYTLKGWQNKRWVSVSY